MKQFNKKMHPLVKFINDCLLDEGSLWITEDALEKKAKRKRIDISELQSLCQRNEIKKQIFDNTTYYSMPFFSGCETEAAYNVMRLLYSDQFRAVPAALIDEKIDKIQNEIGITLHAQQREAVHTMVNNAVCVITGGPGTGKTCTLNTALRVIEEIYPGISIKLTAPTGKAAGRMTESTQRPARTVHREIHLTYTKKIPDYFEGDVLVIDEVSMLDMEIAGAVFKSLKNGQRIIMVGDIEQLPSVGNGAVLRDMLNSCVIPFTMLTKTFRQAAESALFGNILRVKNGNPNLVSDNEEFVIVKALGTDKILNQLAEIYVDEVKKVGIDNVVCLVPFRKKGTACSNMINNILQQKINPIRPGKLFIKSKLETGEPVFFIVGDPVMQIVNREECANGDVGKVIGIEGDELIVKYKGTMGEDVIVRYWKSQIPANLSLAYSMSVNKSQGSEYKTVIMCMTMEHKNMLTRNMLYTGITRAKKRVVFVEEREATEIAMRNVAMYDNEVSKGRTTLFGEKLRFYKNQYEHAANIAV